MRLTLTILCGVLLGVWATGCVEHTQPVGPAPKLTVAQENFEAVWQASIEVLRRHYFIIDRQDRRDGVITTQPLVGQHWTEFWRSDAATPKDLAESSLQTIYRTVKVKVQPTATGADTFRATVEVSVSRSDRPDLQVTSTSEAYSLFTLASSDQRRRQKLLMDHGTTPEGEVKERSHWNVPLGRDGNLESKLTADIQIEIAKRRAIHQP
jgi:hypothetical protein